MSISLRIDSKVGKSEGSEYHGFMVLQFEHLTNQEDMQVNEVVENQWQEYQDQCTEIYQHGLEHYQAEWINPEELRQACFQGEKVVCCIDERVPGSLHCAGSLILLEENEAKELVKQHEIEGVTSHSDCGAMAIVYRQEHGLADGAPVESGVLNQYAENTTRTLAERLGVAYKGHIGTGQMKGTEGLHNARSIYYHSTPFLNAQKVMGLPPGFMISRSLLSAEQAVTNADLAVAIAFGAHGFGERFTTESPLLLVGVYEEDGSQKAELESELQPLVDKYQGRVRLEFLPVKKV